jgi:hypothetical protein
MSSSVTTAYPNSLRILMAIAFYTRGGSAQVGDPIAPWILRPPRGRLLGLSGRWPAGSLPIQCWVAYATSTNGLLDDLSRYGCDIGTPQVPASSTEQVVQNHHQAEPDDCSQAGVLFVPFAMALRDNLVHHNV